jgi:O-methyltransferase domain/Dimerisation domain
MPDNILIDSRIQKNIVFSQNRQADSAYGSDDDRLIWDTWMSMFHFPTLTIADEIGLFSLLEKMPLSASDIADKLSLGSRATEALLGVMVSLGYLVQQDGQFSLTDVSRNFLLPESPCYWGGMLKLMAKNPLSHSDLLEALKKDKSSVYQEQDVWETHELEPEKARLFTFAMQSMTMAGALGVAKESNWESVNRLLDVGGGSAAISIALAKAYPQLHCTIFELPVVCNITKEYINDANLSERIDTYAGNFFTDPLPPGYDAILFGNIFHDWGWEKCLHLAKRSFEALPSGGHIYLHEMLLSDTKDSPTAATSFSMCMIWWTEGKQLAPSEVKKLLEIAGFDNVAITPTHSYYSLVSARKP